MGAPSSDAVEHLAPCGLDCTRCVSFVDGSARGHASGLAAALAGYENMAARMAGFVPALAHYAEFKAVLEFLTSGSCTGCRSGGTVVPFCAARTCFREKGVDFCFQCDEFPCTRNHYPDMLRDRWLSFGRRMQEIGADAFYDEQRVKPRY